VELKHRISLTAEVEAYLKARTGCDALFLFVGLQDLESEQSVGVHFPLFSIVLGIGIIPHQSPSMLIGDETDYLFRDLR
jgi:hypothetical protein